MTIRDIILKSSYIFFAVENAYAVWRVSEFVPELVPATARRVMSTGTKRGLQKKVMEKTFNMIKIISWKIPFFFEDPRYFVFLDDNTINIVFATF